MAMNGCCSNKNEIWLHCFRRDGIVGAANAIVIGRFHIVQPDPVASTPIAAQRVPSSRFAWRSMAVASVAQMTSNGRLLTLNADFGSFSQLAGNFRSKQITTASTFGHFEQGAISAMKEDDKQ